MDISLISQDRELYELCSEVVGELFGSNATFRAGESSRKALKADLCIWDFHPDLVFPDEPDWTFKRSHFFLLQRRQLGTFREKVPFPEVNLLLKPVTRATLKAFLGQPGALAPAHLSSVEAKLNSVRADREEMLQCLIQANLKLQEYDQERTNFLARAVHDFRAPLTALCGYCGLLLGEQLGPLNEDQREVLQRMQHSARRLSRMASAMFQLSIGGRIETRPNLQKGDIRECVEQAVHEMLPLSDEKDISITLDLIPAPQPLYFERSQMEQVLINILDNACKFTPRSGLVEIRGYPFFWERRRGFLNTPSRPQDRRVSDSHAPNCFRLDIRDSGSSIPANHLDRIFEEYTSYSGGQDRSGGGLGLAICRLILSRHQGRIWAESSSQGAIFSLVLPFQLTEGPLIGENGNIENTLPVEVL